MPWARRVPHRPPGSGKLWGPMATDVDPWAGWREQLTAAHLLIPLGEPGIYGRGSAFEEIVDAVSAVMRRAASQDRPTVVRFPPALPERAFLRSGYVHSFPSLIGEVRTFSGGEIEHRRLLGLLESGGEWSSALTPTGTFLCAAACHPLYATLSSPIDHEGRRWDVLGTVFRHEPSLDPARMQTFRQYEQVFVGGTEGAVAHRDTWLRRSRELLTGLGLDVTAEPANDPFFGRSGRLLARNQLQGGLKHEILAPTGPAEHLTAIASVNYHQDHFGTAFELSTPSGAPAHSACVGWGLERITLALLWKHGLDPETWPTSVRGELWG